MVGHDAMDLIHPIKVVQECYWIVNSVIKNKNVNELCLHFNVCLLSLLTFKMVLMTLRLALMKVYFFLLYAE